MCRRVAGESKLDAQTVPWALNRSSRDENYYGQTLIGSGAIWLFVREKAVVPVESAATEHLSPGQKTRRLYGLHSIESLVGKVLGEGCCAAEPGSSSGLFLVSSVRCDPKTSMWQLHAATKPPRRWQRGPGKEWVNLFKSNRKWPELLL